MTLSAIAATLVTYLKDSYEKEIPIWNMISTSQSEIANRAEEWREKTGVGALERARSAIGGGSLPGQTLPTTVLVIEPVGSADSFASRLRQSPVAVIARIDNGKVLLDPRTVMSNQNDAVIEAINFALDHDSK
jgi:L-seryl-tRNA(Ser) seleniumtransferase